MMKNISKKIFEKLLTTVVPEVISIEMLHKEAALRAEMPWFNRLPSDEIINATICQVKPGVPGSVTTRKRNSIHIAI